MSDSSNGVRDPQGSRGVYTPKRQGTFSQGSRFSRSAVNGREFERSYEQPNPIPSSQRARAEEAYRPVSKYAPDDFDFAPGRRPSHAYRPEQRVEPRARRYSNEPSADPSYDAVSRYAGAEGYRTRSRGAQHSRAQHQRRDRPSGQHRGYPNHQGSRSRRDTSDQATGPQLANPIITNHAEGYQTRAPHLGPAKQRSKAPKIVGIVTIAVVAVVAVVWLWTSGAFASEVPIVMNGSELVVKPGTTLANIVEEGYAKPAAGNLMAIDGSLLQEGGGEPFSATVNGEAAPTDYEVKPQDDVIIVNGNDTTEETSTEQVEIPFETTSDSNSYGALHRYMEGQNGIAERVTGKVSGIVQENVVQEPVNAGYIQYNADTGDDKVVALTFDDGPWEGSTQEILDILAENDAKATFFTIGNQISDHADVVKKAAEAGHQICTHSWDHADGSGQGVNLTYMTPEEQVQEIQKGFDAISDATGQEASTVIRSPGGNFYGEIINTLQPYISAEINWNIDTEDWKRPGSDAIVSAIKDATAGDVILMHDGGGDRSQTVEALRTALPYLREQGFRFVTIDELLSYPVPGSATSSDATTVETEAASS